MKTSLNEKEKELVNRWEICILKAVKRKAMTEKSIARCIQLSDATISEFLTNLMLKGYIERRRRKRRVFFSREYFTITLEGLGALEAAECKIDKMIELVKEGGQQLANEILMSLPPLARDTIKTTYKVATFILK